MLSYKKYLPLELNIILSFTLFMLLYRIGSDVKFKYSFIANISGVGVKFFIELCMATIFNLLEIDIPQMLSNKVLKTILSLVPVFIVLLLYYICKNKNINIVDSKKYKHESKNKSRSKKDKEKNYKIIVVFGIINLLLMEGIALIYFYRSNQLYIKDNLLIYCLIIAGVFCISGLIIFTSILYKNNGVMQIEQNLMNKNIKQMEETVELLRIQKHDYMNHLQVILMQIDKGNKDDAKKYILSLSDYSSNKLVQFETGNNYLDAILNFKNGRCIEYSIELTACVDSLLNDTSLLDTHISSIILNIIDNAIDELKNNVKDNKYIHLDTYRDDNYHHISIKNNGSKITNINKIFEKGYSSKGENRGYGLYSIKKLLEDNHCTIEVCSDEYETEFMIKLPISQVG